MAKRIPKHITIILNETETVSLLDLRSCIVVQATEEGNAVLLDNQQYIYLTTGKGRSRKLNTIGVQTIPFLFRTRHTEPVKYEFRDTTTFVSNWEMYDTYCNRLVEETAYREEDEVSLLSNESKLQELNDHELNEEISLTELKQTQEERDIKRLWTNERYFEAVQVIERLLANNCYNKEQKQFKGILRTDVDQSSAAYNYKLDLLWTFANEDTKSRCVTGIAFNILTEDIFAIGYGKYYFKDRKNTGVVMVWNIKNPKQPEREYYFKHSVTCLAFSSKIPSYLGVGFYNGGVKIIDISKRELTLVGEDCLTSSEPVWDMLWFDQDEKEYFLACFGDGRVCKYSINGKQLKGKEILRINKVEGKLKGKHALRMFEGNQISSSRYASGVCLSLHAANPSIFLVATNEGVIHKHSANYITHHRSTFKAHEGSVHSIKFSPFVNKVFGTCGDDFQECIWLEGINEPLITLKYCLEPVLDFDWSPSHSTIVVSLHGMDINLWDFQRKIYTPQSQTKSPTNSRNTLCRFTSSGRCLLIGDIDGNVNVFSVNGLPHPAFFQQNLFFQSIKKLINTNSNLLKQLNTVGPLNFKPTESTFLD